jgi:hypothetical protein
MLLACSDCILFKDAAIRMLGYGTAAEACDDYIVYGRHRLLKHIVSFVKS